MSSTEPRGRFVWYDLMTTDPEAATIQQIWLLTTPSFAL